MEGPSVGTSPPWNVVRRIAFRFWFLYVGLYIVVTQVLATIFIPGVDVPDPGTLGLVRAPVEWVARHLFGVSADLVVTGSGSGDKIFDWTQVVCLLAIAALGAALWSVLDRRRPGYDALERWLRLAVRIALGSTMILYGLSKLVPLQMPYPNLVRLIEPYGNLSPMGVLWASIGASPAYEIFTGCAETLGGVLLLLPRTAFLGALVCLADVIEVFVLNMTYDVPVKLFSFHLILAALYLLAPEWPRLRDLFLRNRGVGPSTEPPLFRSARANRIAARVLAIYLVYLLAMNVRVSLKTWKEYGAEAATRAPFYGIWNVESMVVDGTSRPALVNDADRWRRVVFPNPVGATVQRMDDAFLRLSVEATVGNRRLALKKRDDEKWMASFLVERPAPDRLVLDGDIDHRRARLELRRVDESKFLLVTRGFHWVQEQPFNR
ncbi:MAG TPA: DoxX family protein [Thermoanaerobaculia bacterium]|jgi:uncharacterized membrane protein YphA (DoxX/SURF4 family)